MFSINYSIIIPHKNIPQLLQRCLDSIPERDDVQVIVVDDNSSPKIVDFNNFPGKDRKNTEIVLTTDGNGAGYVRNVGLSKAQGNWVIFIDADDLFSDNLCKILDENINTSADLIIYDRVSVMSDNLSVISKKGDVFHNLITEYLMGRIDNQLIRCNFPPIHGKIINRKLLINNNIKFSETKWSNDIFFSTQVGCFASTIEVFNDIMYILTERPGSLTACFCGTHQEFKVRMSEAIKSETFIKAHKIKQKMKESNSLMMFVIDAYGYRRFLQYMLLFIPFTSEWNRMFAFSVHLIYNKLRNS